jgi:hypothetical protein
MKTPLKVQDFDHNTSTIDKHPLAIDLFELAKSKGKTKDIGFQTLCRFDAVCLYGITNSADIRDKKGRQIHISHDDAFDPVKTKPQPGTNDYPKKLFLFHMQKIVDTNDNSLKTRLQATQEILELCTGTHKDCQEFSLTAYYWPPEKVKSALPLSCEDLVEDFKILTAQELAKQKSKVTSKSIQSVQKAIKGTGPRVKSDVYHEHVPKYLTNKGGLTKAGQNIVAKDSPTLH